MKKILLLAIACLTIIVAFSQDKKSKTPASKTNTSAKTYTCSMHPEVVSDKPGKCPKCGMALVEKVTYVCPMHPDVVSDKPGKCPRCGMQLKIKSAGKEHEHPDSTHKM